MNWTLVQSFVTVAETGSLSEAARHLGHSQPTLGRQIRQIEADLEVTLFHRQARGLHLTEAGAQLLPHAQAMAAAAQDLSLAAAGQSDRLSGPVRITSSVYMAHHVLPPMLARLRQAEPDITLDLVPTDRTENLLFREADIAVRMVATEQLDIVTRHMGELRLGFFAARSYLDHAGWPETFEDIWTRDVIGYDRSEQLIRGLRAYGIPATRDWFSTRCDNQTAYFELIRAGCGIGFAQEAVARRDPDLVQLFPEVDLPTLPVWLAAPEAMRHTPRLRRVWDELADGLLAYIAAQNTPVSRSFS